MRTTFRRHPFMAGLTGLLAVMVMTSAAAETDRVSVASGGIPANGDSRGVDISGDGRFVVFGSSATNLVSGGTSTFDIYVRDRDLGLTELVSKNAQGQSGSSTSLWPSISSDGRYVTFHSIASNLVPGDDNGNADVFLYDRETDTITLVSKALDGSSGNGRSQRAEISADGSYVVFESGASDLVSVPTNGVGQVYGYDVVTGVVTLLSTGIGGAADLVASEPSVSRSGKNVLFKTFATLTNCPPNCGNLYVRQRESQTTVAVPDSGSLQAGRASISGNGRYVAWSTNARTSLVDRVTGNTTLLQQSDLTLNPRSWSRFSDDSRYFVFWEAQTSSSAAPYRMWRYDVFAGVAEVVTLDSDGMPLSEGARAPGTFGPPGISDNGRIVAFWSEQDGVVDNDTGGIEDVYITSLSGDFQAPSVGPISIDPTQPLAREPFTVSATADDTATGASAIIAGEFAIDGGAWLPAVATDGAFDSPVETFERTLDDLAPGPYEVCVRATDGFGNTSDGLECAKLNIAINPDIIEIIINNPPLVPGGSFDASAGGFKPFSNVQAFLESTPVLVGEQQADGDGNVAFSLTVPPGFPPGQHTLAFVGVAPDDSPRRLTLPVTIEIDPTVLKSGFEPSEDGGGN